MRTNLNELKLSPDFIRLNAQALEQEGVRTPLVLDAWDGSKETAKQERELQKLCEQRLSLWGYSRLTADNIVKGTDKGYFGHIPGKKAKANMFLLDLLILGPTGRFLQVELKNPGPIRWQPGQKEMIEQGYGVLAQTYDEFVAAVTKWENEA